MTRYRREGQVTDEYSRPVPGASIYVFDQAGNSVDLSSDDAGANPLEQPLTSDQFGGYTYYANAAVLREDTHFAGKLRMREVTPVGLDGLYPPADGRPGTFFAFDADNNPVAASGTGADAGLRTDLAANTGTGLIKHKVTAQSGVTTYGRSVAALKELGAEESDGLGLFNFIDPNLDDAFLAGNLTNDVMQSVKHAITELASRKASRGGRQKLLIPAFAYKIDHDADLAAGGSGALVFSVDDLVIDGQGAVLSTSSAAIITLFNLTGARQTINGLKFDMTAPVAANPVGSVRNSAPGNRLNQVDVARVDGTANIPFYSWADDFTWMGGSLTGSRGINCFNASRQRFGGGLKIIQATSGGIDDGIAIKAQTGEVTGTVVDGVYFENCANFLALGSEIGYFGGKDPSPFSRGVYKTILANCGGLNCAAILWVKPGAGDSDNSHDYRDGCVADVVGSNLLLRDPLGTMMQRPIVINPARGASIEKVSLSNVKVRGRLAASGGGRQAGLLDVYITDFSGSYPGTSAPNVDGIEIDGEFTDRWNGVANGTGGAPGQPAPNIAVVEKQTAGFGTVSNVVLKVRGNGTMNSGIVVQATLDDAVTIANGTKLANINNSGSAVSGGVQTKSRVLVEANVSISTITGSPYTFPTAGSGDILCPELKRESYLGTLGATATPSLAICAPRRAELISVKMLTTNALSLDGTNTNTTTINLANLDLAATNFASWGTGTGASGSAKRSAVVANTLTPIYHRRDVTVTADTAQGLFPSEGRLQFVKSSAGTGGALNDTRMIEQWAPY